jgi:23S rRNA pseudouridine955/2504/2580 synthase
LKTRPYEKDDAPAQQAAMPHAAVRQVTVDEAYADQRLDNFLRRELPDVPKSHVYRVIRKGEVRVNGKRAKPESRLHAGDVVRVPPVRLAPEGAPRRAPGGMVANVEGAIIYEDRDILALDKPAGIAVHGGSGVNFGVIEALRASRPEETLELAHRLDRDTSGCLLVARRPAALRTLHALLRESDFDKRYLALVKGKWELGAKSIDVPLRTDIRVGGERTVKAHASGKPARSDFRPVQFFGKTASLVEVALLTGRTHQIRVHAAHAGYPIAGDPKYGDAAFNESMQRFGLTRMFLHAHSVSFVWPESGKQISISAPLPKDLAAVIDQLAEIKTRRAPARKR